MRLRVHSVAVLVFFAAACSTEAPDSGSDTIWVGTITTEGNVTTVVNESGSVWGGTARLVVEASIGIESGEDAYMFGQVRAIAATDDEIYVLDQQVAMIRVYDMDGRHLRDIGKEGEGPGEFRQPASMVIGPSGRIYVRDSRNGRISVLSPDGDELATMHLNTGFGTSTPMVITGPNPGNGPKLGYTSRTPNPQPLTGPKSGRRSAPQSSYQI